MNLHSLPPELLARVFSYTGYATINDMRKLDSRVNTVAKAYHCGTRIPVWRMMLHSHTYAEDERKNGKLLFTSNMHIEEYVLQYHKIKNKTLHFREQDGTPIELLDNLLERLEVKGGFCFNNCRFSLDDSIFEVLQKHRQNFVRKVTGFHMVNTNILCSRATAEHFISSAKKLRSLSVDDSATNMDVFISPSVLENRQWQYLSIESDSRDYTFKHKYLNDRFLQKVVKNCHNCCIRFLNITCTNFTANGVIKMIETIQQENKTPEHIMIGATILDGPTFLSEETKIRAIPGIESTFTQSTYLVHGEIPRRYADNHCQIRHPAEHNLYMFDFHMFYLMEQGPHIIF